MIEEMMKNMAEEIVREMKEEMMKGMVLCSMLRLGEGR